jgi:hypothetical protein
VSAERSLPAKIMVYAVAAILALAVGAGVGTTNGLMIQGDREAQARTQDFDYIVPIRPWHLSNAELAKAMDGAKTAGVNTIALEVTWAHVDLGDSTGKPRTYDWYQIDRVLNAAESRDLKVTFVITQTPDWVHPHLERTISEPWKRIWYPPRGSNELKHWSNFIRDLVSHCKGRVSQYQIWNEPNDSFFWRPDPRPAEYVALARTAYLSAKGVDPQATIVLAGLSRNDLGYLAQYYHVLRSSYPNAAEHDYFFDVLGVHPYSDDRSPDAYHQDAIYQGEYGEVDGNFLGFRRMKALMNNNADSGKNLLLSEYGFSTEDTWMKAVRDSRRALYLKRAYELARSFPYVQGLSWYAYHPTRGDPMEWAIVDGNFNPTLTYRALRQVTGFESSSARVAISIPEDVSGTVSITPELHDLKLSDISYWELYVDGALVGQQRTIPISWDTSRTKDGSHRVMVAAYTKEGSVWHSNIAGTSVGS